MSCLAPLLSLGAYASAAFARTIVLSTSIAHGNSHLYLGDSRRILIYGYYSWGSGFIGLQWSADVSWALGVFTKFLGHFKTKPPLGRDDNRLLFGRIIISVTHEWSSFMVAICSKSK